MNDGAALFARAKSSTSVVEPKRVVPLEIASTYVDPIMKTSDSGLDSLLSGVGGLEGSVLSSRRTSLVDMKLKRPGSGAAFQASASTGGSATAASGRAATQAAPDHIPLDHLESLMSQSKPSALPAQQRCAAAARAPATGGCVAASQPSAWLPTSLSCCASTCPKRTQSCLLECCCAPAAGHCHRRGQRAASVAPAPWTTC